MGLVSFSRGYMTAGYTNISNVFMEEHLPYANGDCVRVYLYGLYLCQNSTSADNTIEMMSTKLGISVANIKDAFEYWEKQNLVQILDTVPMEIKYLPIKRNSAKVRELPKGQYDDFNTKAQAILDGRMITTTEFHEYYAFMESMHFEPEALLLVIKNCVLAKDSKIGWKYILTCAKNFAYNGLTTHKAVSDDIKNGQKSYGPNYIKQIHKVKPNFSHHSYSEESLKEVEHDVSEY